MTKIKQENFKTNKHPNKTNFKIDIQKQKHLFLKHACIMSVLFENNS